MKKTILIAAIAAVIVIGFGMIRNRIGGLFLARQNGGDLIIINDSPETASSAFMRNGKMVSQVMHSGERASGGRGLMRIFVAKKNGAYEIQYPFPRPAGKPAEISLMQIFDAARRPEMNQELYTQKGMIDDIRVDYEEIRDLD